MLRDHKLISLGRTDGYIEEYDHSTRISLWDLDSGELLLEAFDTERAVGDSVLSPNERIFVTFGAIGEANDHSGFVHIWDAHRLRQIGSFLGHRTLVTAAAFSVDGNLLATGDKEGFVRIWDVSSFSGL